MLQTVTVGRWSLSAYEGIAPEAVIEQLRQNARSLQGARILHVNATPYGGGVSELLRSSVPLLRDLGLHVDWNVIGGNPDFFHATKALHNALQGAPRPLTEAEQTAYQDCVQENAATLDGDYDFIVIHDPQPVGLLQAHGKGRARWIWRCHIDTSEPNPDAWSFLKPYLEGFDAAVFTMPEFIPPGLPVARTVAIAPAIDPLSPKNIELDPRTADQILDWIGVDLPGRLITQVSRFDAWKDPLGVIDAYRLVREETPSLQLALVGSMALDDPEGWEVYRQVSDAADEDPLIHIYTNLTGVGNVEVNAFQRLSEVVVQKSIREGFGLVVSESLWKGTPVVAGQAGGIPLQMKDGVGGRLVQSTEQCASALLELLSNPELAQALGQSGRERVREHYLLPRLLMDELALFATLDNPEPALPTPGAPV
ncbi:MAG TPA: glycosyltransferase [Solirubrobacteraceae bacterium]|nr:glycosyltransferase [Solirubrobacteraceae bacterium]